MVTFVTYACNASLSLSPTLSPSGEGGVGVGIFVPGAPSTVAPVITAEAALIIASRVKLGILGVFDFGGESTIFDENRVQRGTLTSRSGLVLPSAQLCLDFGLRLCGGVFAGARIVEGTASGTYIFQRTTSRFATFTFGPTAQLAFIRGPFRIALDASLLIDPNPASFPIEGLTTPLTFPIAQGLFRLSIGLGTSR